MNNNSINNHLVRGQTSSLQSSHMIAHHLNLDQQQHSSHSTTTHHHSQQNLSDQVSGSRSVDTNEHQNLSTTGSAVATSDNLTSGIKRTSSSMGCSNGFVGVCSALHNNSSCGGLIDSGIVRNKIIKLGKQKKSFCV